MRRFFHLWLLAVLVPANLFAQSFGLTDPVKTKGGITYMCSGIGESKHDPRVATFPLKVVFATNSSALYSDVNVRIDDEGGKPVFDLFCDGAWLLVKLPPGNYRVSGTDQRKLSRSCQVSVGGGQTQCVLRWPD